jgi:hypothetical protein
MRALSKGRPQTQNEVGGTYRFSPPGFEGSEQESKQELMSAPLERKDDYYETSITGYWHGGRARSYYWCFGSID